MSTDLLPNDPGSQPSEELTASAGQFLSLVEGVWATTTDPALGIADFLPLPLGRYLLQRVLGAGTFGVVYLADDPTLGRSVALKVGRGPMLATPELRQVFLNEARAAAPLDHPGIIPVYEAGEVGPFCYIASLYVPGSSLARYLADHSEPLPFRCVAGLLIALADAMEHAHQRGILHCDLKPANILLSPQPSDARALEVFPFQPRIADFGLARRLHHPSANEMVLAGGTPLYMSPEQANGKLTDLTAQTDVYALGVILYELLVGRTPFVGCQATSVRQQVLTGTILPPRQRRPAVPRDLEAICLRCLERELDKRYPSTRELAADLRRFLEHKPTRARPLGPFGRSLRFAWRHPVRSLLLLLLVGIGIGLLLMAFRFSARMGELRALAGQAEERADEQEFHALLHLARNRISNRTPGWSRDALADLRRAAALPNAAKYRDELRTAALSCLMGIDMCLERHIAPDIQAHSIAFHPKNHTLALGSNFARGTSTELQLLDPETGTLRHRLFAPVGQDWQTRHKRLDGIREIAFSADGRWLACGSRSGWLHCWDLRVEPPARLSWQGHERAVTGLFLVVYPMGTVLLSGADDGKARSWVANPLDPKAPWQLSGEVTGLAQFTRTLALTPDQRMVYLPKEDKIARYTSTLSHSIGSLPLYDQLPTTSVEPGLGASVWGEHLYLSDYEHGVHVHEFRHLDGKAHEGSISSAVFSPHVDLLASACRTNNRVRIWEVGGGCLACELHFSGGPVIPAFSKDGRRFAVAASNGAHLYTVFGNTYARMEAARPARAIDFTTANDDRLIMTLTSPPNPPQSFGDYEVSLWAFDHENYSHRVGRWLPQKAPRDSARIAMHPASRVAAVPRSNRLCLFLPRPETLTHTVPDITDVDFGSDGRLWLIRNRLVEQRDPTGGRVLASWEYVPPPARLGYSNLRVVKAGSRYTVVGSRDGFFQVLNSDCQPLGGRWISLDAIQTVTLRADEKLAAVGATGGRVILLSLPDATEVASWQAHQGIVGSVLFYGSRLATGGEDRKLILWNLAPHPQRDLSIPLPRAVERIRLHRQGVLVLLRHEFSVRYLDITGMENRLEEMGLGK